MVFRDGEWADPVSVEIWWRQSVNHLLIFLTY